MCYCGKNQCVGMRGPNQAEKCLENFKDTGKDQSISLCLSRHLNQAADKNDAQAK